jgi:hypothetical protein
MKLKVPQARPFIHGLAAGGEKMFRAQVMERAGGAQLARALSIPAPAAAVPGGPCRRVEMEVTASSMFGPAACAALEYYIRVPYLNIFRFMIISFDTTRR